MVMRVLVRPDATGSRAVEPAMNFWLSWIITTALFIIPIRLFSTNRLPAAVFYTYGAILILIGIILPLLFHFSLFLQRGVLYFYFLDKPADGMLNDPSENYGLPNVRNFYIQNYNISIGVWHILPASVSSTSPSDPVFEDSLRSGLPIILYIHGNVGSRASADRLCLYKTLRALDCHIIAFDYRCFGDSTFSTPYEEAIVSDCLAVAQWVINNSGPSPVFFYGHSLGTGMTTHMAAKLQERGYAARGIVLQAPFDNMPSEISVHPFGTIFRIFPWYGWLFSDPYKTNGETYDSVNHILKFPSPILILHAEDDGTIPSSLGHKLYQHGQANRAKGSGPLSIHIFEAKRGYGHTNLCTAPETSQLIRNFIDRYKNQTFTIA